MVKFQGQDRLMENVLSHFARRLRGLARWLLLPPPTGPAPVKATFDKPKDGATEPAKPIEMIPLAFL